MDSFRIAGLFVPSLCPLCRRPLDPSSLICGSCMRDVNLSRVIRDEPPEGIDRIASCAEHEGVARDLLAAFKFRQMNELAGLIAGFMADIATADGTDTLAVGVPPALLRTWLRGFDPVAMLGEEVSRITGIPTPREAVLARRGSGRQRGRSRAGRLSDPPDIRPVEGAGRILGGREVLLIDDVMTTGATLTTAATALRTAGATRISALTFTRRL